MSRRRFLRRPLSVFPGDERGSTAIEYSLIALFISVTVVLGATLIGGNISATLSLLASAWPG